ncbi:MAG: CAP domain-containing protein [Chloroflexota bacterium]|nr:hypothetical protein [Chloroflexota bacterium]
MGRPWWYDSYWERQGKPPGGRLPTNRRNSSTSGCLIVFIVIFVLLLFGLVVWSLSGSQTSPSTNPPPTVTEPSQQSPATNVPSSTSTPPPVEPAPAPETVKPPESPSIPVQTPVYQHEELLAYALELINRDRMANGLEPVTLGSNTAAQKHAEERLANRFSSHWGMDGLKPYMRYTLAGGENYEAENGFMTETYWIGGRDPSYKRDPKEMLEQAQQGLMTSPGHRKNILNEWHKKVNLGIAYDNERLDLVQQFEGNYIDFNELPSISGDILSLAGKVTLGTIENVSLYYDPLPKPLSPEQLDAPPYDYAYGLGEDIGTILPPLPSGFFYIDLLPTDVVATTWETNSDGLFTIKADISKMLEVGEGVYTIVVWVEANGEFISVSNYSIFID